jgi:hypothetical protein
MLTTSQRPFLPQWPYLSPLIAAQGHTMLSECDFSVPAISGVLSHVSDSYDSDPLMMTLLFADECSIGLNPARQLVYRIPG